MANFPAEAANDRRLNDRWYPTLSRFSRLPLTACNGTKGFPRRLVRPEYRGELMIKHSMEALLMAARPVSPAIFPPPPAYPPHCREPPAGWPKTSGRQTGSVFWVRCRSAKSCSWGHVISSFQGQRAANAVRLHFIPSKMGITRPRTETCPRPKAVLSAKLRKPKGRDILPRPPPGLQFDSPRLRTMFCVDIHLYGPPVWEIAE